MKNIKHLLKKEIYLCLSPINYIFLSFASMMCVPNYPRYIPFFYITLNIFFVFNNAQINNDILYSQILPIAKKDIVKARCLLVIFVEILEFAISIPFAIIGAKVVAMPNAAGINANFAFYGMAMIPLTLWHIIFFSAFYKKAERPGIPYLLASIVFFAAYIVLDTIILLGRNFQVPLIMKLDSFDVKNFPLQIPILFAGILIYILGWIFTYKISAKRFEKVDL